MTTPLTPRRSSFKPRAELPTPNEQVEHWHKHPSDYHADIALTRLIESLPEADTLRTQNILREAQVHAILSLRDAVLEATATLKDIARQLPERKD